MQWYLIIPVVHGICQSTGTFTHGKPSHWAFRGSGKSRRLFKLVAVTSLSRAEQFLSPPALYGNPGGTSHIHASMVCLQLCLQIRKKQTKFNKVLGKKVWRKVRKSKGQWLKLDVSFDLCDSTHWSPSAPLPRPASLSSPSKHRTIHRNLWRQKVHPQLFMGDLYNWTLEAGQHSPWTGVFCDVSDTLFYFRYPKVRTEARRFHLSSLPYLILPYSGRAWQIPDSSLNC